MKLQDKTVVITGTTSGLGLAFSKALAARGANVFGLARRESQLRETETELGESYRGITCDVAREEDVRRAFERIAEEARGVDVLVNNAGLGKYGRVDALTADDWDVQMAVNLRGVFLCTRAAIPLMQEQNRRTGFGGHIVNVASVAGLIGNPGMAAYNTSKFGLRGFSEALMKEVRYDGIKVTCLYPGSIQTDFFQTADTSIAPNPMAAEDVVSTLIHVLETPENYLISEVMMRPLRPQGRSA